MTDKLEKLPPRKEIGDVISDVLTNLAEGLTGIAASDRKQWALSLGCVMQRTRGGQFLNTLWREWSHYREAGKIKDEYQFSEQAQACLQEMLDFLDNDSPDEIRFTVMKKVFLVAATEKVSKRDSVLPQQYMRICRGLSSGEILVLSAAFEISKTAKPNQGTSPFREWLQNVAAQSGLKHPSLVEIHEEELLRKHLLVGHNVHDHNMVWFGDHYRLTEFGYELCKFINAYEPISETGSQG
jgi:hypothetical protein